MRKLVFAFKKQLDEKLEKNLLINRAYLNFVIGLFSDSQCLKFKQIAQLSQRDRAAGWVSYGQKWKTGTGRQYFTDIIGLSSTTKT